MSGAYSTAYSAAFDAAAPVSPPPPVVSSSRQSLLDALGKVDGLNPTPAAPPVVVAGSAWVGWARSEPVNACVSTDTYYAFVALPNADAESTVDAGDLVWPEVALALYGVAKVRLVEPWAWPVEPGQQAVPVIRFTVEV